MRRLARCVVMRRGAWCARRLEGIWRRREVANCITTAREGFCENGPERAGGLLQRCTCCGVASVVGSALRHGHASFCCPAHATPEVRGGGNVARADRKPLPTAALLCRRQRRRRAGGRLRTRRAACTACAGGTATPDSPQGHAEGSSASGPWSAGLVDQVAFWVVRRRHHVGMSSAGWRM